MVENEYNEFNCNVKLILYRDFFTRNPVNLSHYNVYKNRFNRFIHYLTHKFTCPLINLLLHGLLLRGPMHESQTDKVSFFQMQCLHPKRWHLTRVDNLAAGGVWHSFTRGTCFTNIYFSACSWA